ncbi:MAG TPA: DUF350 domain-containing protein [Rhodoblastus sp.]|nr:DUF350 domain-containing protein [Rhodoblastus sp.]
MPAELVSGLAAFAVYFAGALAYGALFCAIYTRLTPHREFDLIVKQHNASAAVAFGMTLVGYAIALAGAIHNTQSIVEFLIWGLIATVAQILAFGLANLAHPGLSQAIEQNALAAAVWSGSVAIATGLVTAACMSP